MIPKQAPRAPQYRWSHSYMAALFETDAEILENRINAAEHELITREHELFSAADSARERNAVSAALQALAALRSCCAGQR